MNEDMAVFTPLFPYFLECFTHISVGKWVGILKLDYFYVKLSEKSNELCFVDRTLL